MAGRIRTIKPELREWFAFASLSDAAARLFLMLYTIADDAGRCPADPGFLGGAVFFARPRKPNAVGKLLGELAAAGLIVRYQVNRAPFLAIAEWSTQGSPTHQRIEKSQGPRYPAPESFRSGNGSGNTSGNDSGTDLDHDLDHDRERDLSNRRPENSPPSKPLERADRRASSPENTISREATIPPPITADERAIAMRVLGKLGQESGYVFTGTDHDVGLIVAQLRAGVGEYELRAVVAFCAADKGWADDDRFRVNLVPTTLFHPDKIGKYLDPARSAYASQIRARRDAGEPLKFTFGADHEEPGYWERFEEERRQPMRVDSERSVEGYTFDPDDEAA